MGKFPHCKVNSIRIPTPVSINPSTVPEAICNISSGVRSLVVRSEPKGVTCLQQTLPSPGRTLGDSKRILGIPAAVPASRFSRRSAEFFHSHLFQSNSICHRHSAASRWASRILLPGSLLTDARRCYAQPGAQAVLHCRVGLSPWGPRLRDHVLPWL